MRDVDSIGRVGLGGRLSLGIRCLLGRVWALKKVSG